MAMFLVHSGDKPPLALRILTPILRARRVVCSSDREAATCAFATDPALAGF
jgi:hypothetical protein